MGQSFDGDYIYFTVNVQNDGSVSDRFKIHGIPPTWGSDSSGIKYFHGTTNITAAVRAGTFQTTSLSLPRVIKFRSTLTGDGPRRL